LQFDLYNWNPRKWQTLANGPIHSRDNGKNEMIDTVCKSDETLRGLFYHLGGLCGPDDAFYGIVWCPSDPMEANSKASVDRRPYPKAQRWLQFYSSSACRNRPLKTPQSEILLPTTFM